MNGDTKVIFKGKMPSMAKLQHMEILSLMISNYLILLNYEFILSVFITLHKFVSL